MAQKHGKFRVFSTWIAAGAFAAVICCGEGVHLLPGLGHAPDCHCAGSHQHEFPACPSSNGPIISGYESSEGIGCSDCPVCNFFAGAKCPLIASAATIGEVPIVQQPEPTSPIIGAEAAVVYHSRAPPV